MGPEHKNLFGAYVAELTRARHAAVTERSYRSDSRFVPIPMPDTPGDTAAAPPAAHPRVLGTITTYFFACQRLNSELEAKGSEHFVYPQVFVHEMLSGQQQELWDFLAELPYLPLGLTPDDTWV
jgi:hypothetical protein